MRLPFRVTANRIMAVAAVLTLLIWANDKFDPFHLQDGKIVEPDAPPRKPPPNKQRIVAPPPDESRYVPFGNDLPTVVAFKNDGERECLIQRVEFRVKKKFDTPRRQQMVGAMPPLPVNFTRSHYVANEKLFRLAFQKPQAAPGKEWATLEVSITEPNWFGTTYVGTLTVYYNGKKKKDFKDVEIDVLK